MKNIILSKNGLLCSIKPLTINHIDQAVLLVREVFPYMNHRTDKPEISLRYSVSDNTTKTRWWAHESIYFAQYFVLLDSTGSNVIGLTGLRINTKDIFNHKPGLKGWLGWFCIHPEYRNKGLGSKLLQWSIDYMTADQQITELHIYQHQEGNYACASTLYEKTGFTIYTVQKNYYLRYCKLQKP